MYVYVHSRYTTCTQNTQNIYNTCRCTTQCNVQQMSVFRASFGRIRIHFRKHGSGSASKLSGSKTLLYEQCMYTTCTMHETRAGEPANFLAAPAPDFFPKRLPLRLLFFFKLLRLQGAKNTRVRPAQAPAPDYWLSLAKYHFPRKLVR